MSEPKMKENDNSVIEFIESVEKREEESRRLSVIRNV